MSIFKSSLILSCCLAAILISNSSIAQYRRYHSERGYSHYYYSYPRVSVQLGISSYGHYPYYYSPAYRVYPPGFSIGLRLGVLPFGFRTIYVGPSLFYYYDGIYYRPYGRSYEVASPPLGAQVPDLPRGATVVVIDGQKYYEYYGTYYRENITADNQIWYDVVGVNGRLDTSNESQPEINQQPNKDSQQDNNSVQEKNEETSGSKIDKLPDGCKTVVINHQKYYVSPSGIYYQEVIEKNTPHYEVVGKLSGN